MRVNINYESFRHQMTQLRREFVRLAHGMTIDKFNEILENDVPQLEQDIDTLVPEDTGALADAVTVSHRKLKYGFSVNVTARVYSAKKHYNYAYIQHEQEFEHSKEGAKDHYIQTPFEDFLVAVGQIGLEMADYEIPDDFYDKE